MVLQLEFHCTSIFTPAYNEIYPYQIKSNHNNYHMRVNLRTFPCQLGETKNYTDFSCKPCDAQQGLFSLKQNAPQCDIKDDITTISVTSAQLNLKSGYWRPYLDSKQVSLCSNLIENCDGGWIEGDLSCYQGHIGALCEQCDLYNIRGEGMYAVSQKYKCGSCNDQRINQTILTLVSFWTIISIFISVQSNQKSIKVYLKTIKIHKALQRRQIFLTTNQSSILIKILTNYFQIISAISSFDLNFPNEISTFIYATGSPISVIVYSLDCFLINVFIIEIIYASIIWQLIFPLFYLIIFIIIYLIGTRLRVLKFQSSFLTTTLIYMYMYLQQTLIGELIELLSYRNISGYKWILSNVSYRYDTTEHQHEIFVIYLPILFIYSLAIPIYLFYGVMKNRNNLDDKKIRLKWGYLYSEYKPHVYFWEIVKIFKKEIIIIILNYYQQHCYQSYNYMFSFRFLSQIKQQICTIFKQNIKFIGLSFSINQHYFVHFSFGSQYISSRLSRNSNCICFINLLFKFQFFIYFTIQNQNIQKLRKSQNFWINIVQFLQNLFVFKNFQKSIKQEKKGLRIDIKSQTKQIIEIKRRNSQFLSDQQVDGNIEILSSLRFSNRAEEKLFQTSQQFAEMMSKNEIYSPIISSQKKEEKFFENKKFL